MPISPVAREIFSLGSNFRVACRASLSPLVNPARTAKTEVYWVYLAAPSQHRAERKASNVMAS